MNQTDTRLPNVAQREAIVRWKLGHHVFHTYLAAMNTLFEESIAALRVNEWAIVSHSLQELTTLCDAATSSMKYASDYPPELYETLVRPSMMPPFVSPAFSGDLNRDHEVMMEYIKELRRGIKAVGKAEDLTMPREMREAWSELREATSRNRKHHMFVCEKFVEGGVSLVRDFYEQRETDT